MKTITNIAVALLAGALYLAMTADESAAEGTATLLGQYTLPNPGAVADVWGYVDRGTNREFALVADRSGSAGVFIIDVTEPTNPALASQASGVLAFDVKIRGSYLYVVRGGRGPGGAVFDISDVYNPQNVGSFGSSHNLFIDERGYMYLSKTGSFDDLRIFDLNPDPTVPTFVWEDRLPGPHDALVVGTTLYDFHGYEGTRIYDVTTASSPVLIGEAKDGLFHHSGHPTPDGAYLLITHEIVTHPDPDITVWNIQDPANPFKVTEILDPNATAHNLYIVGDYAYVSFYTAGLRVYDVSNPTRPELAAEFDTSSRTGEVWHGCFGVYPMTPSGNIYVSDMDNGLFVFSFSATTGTVVINSFDARPGRDIVELAWSIGSADGLQGFNMYRALEANGAYTKINATLIASADNEYQDTGVERGVTYWYQLGVVATGGETLSQRRAVTVPRGSVVLHQNAPNPFNPTTTISYEIPVSTHVELTIYNSNGNKVRKLVNGFKTAGPHTTEWNGRNDERQPVTTGVYFARLYVSGSVDTRRMVLLK